MIRTNTVHEQGVSGIVGYSVDLGNILVNGRIVSLGRVSIPIRKQVFFNLPSEKGMYAVVNAYYEIETGNFVFDRVLLSEKFVPMVNARSLPNLIPLAQFVLKQRAGGFDVEAINEYSVMSTYAVGNGGDTGEQGPQGPVGPTGGQGATGCEGITGEDGIQGNTGYQGTTGVGLVGFQGAQGHTGVYPDLSLRLYLKFKSDAEQQTDYSAYHHDCTWEVDGDPVTGCESVSSFSREDGIVDNCHSVIYRGGISSYVCDEYIDFSGYTGVIQAWVMINVPPMTDFSYTGVEGLTGVIRFVEQCSYFPESWAWHIDGVLVSRSRIFTQPVAVGEHLVRLTSSNAAGSSQKTKLIVVS